MVETSRSVCTFTLTEVLQAVRHCFCSLPSLQMQEQCAVLYEKRFTTTFKKISQRKPVRGKVSHGRSLLKTIHFNLVKEKLTGEFIKKKDQVSFSDRDFTVLSKVFRFVCLVFAAIDRYEFFKLIWAQN